MAQWDTYFVAESVNPFGPFNVDQLSFSLVNSDEGDFGCELGLGDPSLARDAIGPYRTDYTLYRDSVPITGGIVNAINLNNMRDTLKISGNDYLHYLKKRIYPFDPVKYRDGTTGYYKRYPVKWVDVDLRDIAQGILEDMIDFDADFLHVPDFGLNNAPTGYTGRYRIWPADTTSIYDHIKAISEMDKGFEFGINPINLEFQMFAPNRDRGNPVYTIQSTGNEATGQILDIDWTNVGPKGTRTLGLGAGNNVKNLGSVKTDPESLDRYRLLETVEDFGDIGNQDILDRKTAYQGSNNLGPEKTLALTLINPETMAPNFYTGGRPRSLIGNRVHCIHRFGYHTVDAYFRVMSLAWTVDDAGNELVDWELSMIAPRLV